MGAIAAVFLSHLAAGDHLVASADCYCDVRSLVELELVRLGISASFIDASDPDAVRHAIRPTTRMVYVETISNPGMKLVDLAALAEIAHAAGALLCVDNTVATPLLCRPLALGADLVLHSATKFLGGHHDLTAGVVVGRTDLIDRLRRVVYLYGATLGPMEAWLALRGIKTLAARLAWACATARAVAAFLEAHPAVACVRYPGLPGHPQAVLAQRLLPDGAGALLAFDLRGGATAAAILLHHLNLIVYAPSFGGPTTTTTYPPRDLVADGVARSAGAYDCATIRLSVGLEATSDIVADLSRALDRVLDRSSHGEHP